MKPDMVIKYLFFNLPVTKHIKAIKNLHYNNISLGINTLIRLQTALR